MYFRHWINGKGKYVEAYVIGCNVGVALGEYGEEMIIALTSTGELIRWRNTEALDLVKYFNETMEEVYAE